MTATTADLATAVQFLDALFEPGDVITIRPTETWTDGAGKRRAIVDFAGVCTVKRGESSQQDSLRGVLDRAKRMRTNIFFGVCPRFGSKWYEKAWQIRMVRVLWADIDHVDVATAQQRIIEAGSPRPSLIVSSGNGVHVYWRLDTPYLIDDVNDPPRTMRDWIKVDSKSKPIEFFKDQHGDAIYLHDQKTGRAIANAAPKLSPKAQQLQDIVSGIASKIGGDHTHDLARLLRVAGTLNRKDQKNGKTPKPTALVEANDERYPLGRFEEFAAHSPDRQRRDRASVMPLPIPRKLTASREDALAQRIAACQIAEDRSKADYSLCCFGIEKGIAPEDLWKRVSTLGKFAERGRDYFDRTWHKAADATRFKLLDRCERDSQKAAEQSAWQATGDDANVGDDQGPIGKAGAIVYDPEHQPVNWLLDQITTTLATSGVVYSRAGRPVQVVGEEITPLDDQPSLAAAVCAQREFMLVETRGENVSQQYLPLTAKYAGPWLKDARQLNKLPPITLFTRCPVWLQTSTGWKVSTPGYDQETGIFYAGPEVLPVDSTTHLDALLRDFCWRSPGDRSNFLGVLLTLVLIQRFIGSKPGVMLNGNQPGVGKSFAAQILSIIQSGRQAPTILYIDREEELEKRFASVVRSGVQTIIVDNAKPAGNHRNGGEVNSAVLDRFVTDNPVSFRLLGFSTDIRAENSFILALTMNAAAVCRDLVSRCVPVNLYWEGDATKRTFNIADMLGYAEAHRFEIIAELLGMVSRWIDASTPLMNVRTRFEAKSWGQTIGGILDVAGDPDFLGNLDDSAEEFDPVRGEFAALVEQMACMSLGSEWTPSELLRAADDAKVLQAELGDGSERCRVTRLGVLTSRFLGQTFRTSGGSEATLRAITRRNGKVYTLLNGVP